MLKLDKEIFMINKVLLVFILAVSFSLEAKLIKDTDEPSEREIICFKNFVDSSSVKKIYPDMKNGMGWEFTLQAVKYCECEAKKLAEDWKEMKEDWIAYAFKDKSKNLQKRDSCSLNSFLKDNDLKLFYQVKYEQWFSPQIVSKIEKHVNGASIKQIVGSDKWMNYVGCAHDMVSWKCSRVKSLNVTHQCIKDNFEPKEYDNIHRSCIFNLTKPVDEEFNKELMI